LAVRRKLFTGFKVGNSRIFNIAPGLLHGLPLIDRQRPEQHILQPDAALEAP